MTDQVRSVRTEHWFFVDNTIIDDYGKDLGAYGIAIYATLCRFANNDRQDCYPSHETLAELTGMSKRQVIRILKQLEELELIRWERQYTESGKQTSNLYLLLDPPSVGVTVSHSRGDCESHKQDSCEQDSTTIPAQAQGKTPVSIVSADPSEQEKDNGPVKTNGEKELEAFFGPSRVTSSAPPRKAEQHNRGSGKEKEWSRGSFRPLPALEDALRRYGDEAPALRALQAQIDINFGLAPDWSSKKAVKSWVTGLKELWVAAGEDITIASAAGNRLRQNGMTISSPRSLTNTARAIAAERATARAAPRATREYV
jgi:hypothetical protein